MFFPWEMVCLAVIGKNVMAWIKYNKEQLGYQEKVAVICLMAGGED
jgi:hypothetical protein